MSDYEIRLKSGEDVLYPQGMLAGIDESNVLVSREVGRSETYRYTLTEDCWIYLSYTGYGSITIAGFQPRINNQYFVKNMTTFPVKKGQEIVYSGAGGSSGAAGIVIVGIKH